MGATYLLYTPVSAGPKNLSVKWRRTFARTPLGSATAPSFTKLLRDTHTRTQPDVSGADKRGISERPQTYFHVAVTLVLSRRSCTSGSVVCSLRRKFAKPV